MLDSILDSTKKVLGIDAEFDAFDVDVIMHINSAFATLNQLGLGPAEGFMIEDRQAVWGDYLEDDLNLNSVRNYVYLKVRIIFDPPATSFTLQSLEKQLEEFTYRLSVYREGRDHS